MTGLRREECFLWTVDRTATLREMWSSGASAATIGRELGTSRCSVIGKARRLGLEGRPQPVAQAKEPGPGRGHSKRDWWGNFWTPERDEVVRRCYSHDHCQPVGVISNTLGCSMTSITRRAKELGLKHPRLPAPGIRLKANIAAASARIYRHPATAPDSNAVPMHELGAQQCRFPVTPNHTHDHLFCGAPTQGSPSSSPYCPFHHAKSYYPYEFKKDAA